LNKLVKTEKDAATVVEVGQVAVEMKTCATIAIDLVTGK
jgi:hypothetical protein